MELNKELMSEFAGMVASAVVDTLEQRNIINCNTYGSCGAPAQSPKSAVEKTEALLYSYRDFKRIVDERMQEIEDIKKYGVPKDLSVQEYVAKGSVHTGGIVLEEESVESAVARVWRTVQRTVQAITLVDKGMAALKYDPYYRILEMRYFEGRTQEDIAVEFGCSQVTISNNKNRLIRELSMRLFPNQIIDEYMR